MITLTELQAIGLRPVKTARSGYIDYSTRTSTHPLYVKAMDAYAPALVTLGNKKLAPTVANTGFMPGIAGTCACDCSECYAKNQVNAYPAFDNKMRLHTAFALDDMGAYFDRLYHELATLGLPYFRPTESGEMFNQEMVEGYAWLMRKLPDIRFYTYTKNTALDLMPLQKLHNVNFASVGTYINYGPIDYLRFLVKQGCTVCPAGWNKDAHCGSTCKRCMNKPNMAFLLHGGATTMKRFGNMSAADWAAHNGTTLDAVADAIARARA